MSTEQQSLRAVGISGSPSPHSRSKILIESVLTHLAAQGVVGTLIDLIELPADALLGRRSDSAIDDAIGRATQADILVLGTPIYRASYTGQLKAFLDLFPQAALQGRVVSLIATGGSPAHALAIDHGLRPLVASLSGLSASQAVYVTDKQFPDKTNVPAEIDQATLGLAQELYILAQGLANARAGQ